VALSDRSELVSISVLGPVRALVAGAPVALGGPRQRAVLARLAMAAGHVVAADRLIDELWDGTPPASAANTLQSYVSNLRKALAGTVPAIERVGDGYRLRTDLVDLEAVRFEDEVADALGGRAAAPAERRAALEVALARWDGPALGDLAGEPWARGEAARLDELRLAAMEARFDLLLADDRAALAVGELTAAVEAFPLRERLVEQLALALARTGRRNDAIAAVERARARLADELGLDPGPGLAALAERLAADDPTLTASGPPPVRPSIAPAAGPAEAFGEVGPPRGALDLPPAVTERRERTAFVGRGEELARLTASLDAVAAGDRRLVVVQGEAGMGKTRLAQVFAHAVHDVGGHVLWGRCTAENLVAYQPAAEALRTALRAVSPERVRAIVAPRPALRLLLPEGTAPEGALDDGAGGRAASRTERYELYEGLAEVIGAVSLTGPVVFVVDDAQWADRSSLHLIEHLVRQDVSGRLLVLATVRRPAGRPTDDLDRLVADLRRDQRLDLVTVGGMGASDAMALLGDRGVEVDDLRADALVERTGGNPFFLESLAARGGDILSLDDRDLPESVRDLIDLRLEGLDDEAARVLTTAAVIGLRIELDVLERATGLDPDALLDQVDAAVDSGVLVEDEELGWVTFPHALVRQALVARTTRNREAQLHLQVAEAIDARHGAAAVVAVADHLRRAGRLCPPARAARAAVDAGLRSLNAFADDEARTWGRRAVEAATAIGDDDERWAVEAPAQLLVAEASRRLGEVAVARAVLERVEHGARARRDGHVLARAAQERALSTAGVGFAFGTVDHELLALLDEALDLLPVDDDEPHRTAVLAWSSIALNSALDRRRQSELATAALAGARQHPDHPDLLALALLAERLAHATPDGLDRRLEVGPTMHDAATAAGWSELVVVGMVLDVVDLLEHAQADAARRRIDELEAVIAPFHRPVYDAYHLFLAAAVAQMEGHHADADALSAKADELGEISHADNARHARAGQQFLLARDLGIVGQITELTGAMVAAYPGMPVWLTGHATACAAAGMLDEARDALEQVFATGGLDARDSTWSTTVAQLAEVCWLLDDPGRGRQLADLLEPYADRMAVTGMGAVCLGPLHRFHGLALAAAGDVDAAVDALDRAVALALDQGATLNLARSIAERGILLERRDGPGDAEQAAEDRVRSHALADQLGIRLALGPEEYPAP